MEQIGKLKIAYDGLVKIPIFDHREIWLVQNNRRMSISGNMLIYDGKYAYNPNLKDSFKDKYILGTYKDFIAKDDKVLKKLEKYYNENYIYGDDVDIFENFKKYLLESEYNLEPIDNHYFKNDIVIILDKPAPKLTGIKNKIKVDVCLADFTVKYVSNVGSYKNVIDVDVYSTPFDENAKDIVYSAYIPNELFVAALSLPDIKDRPSNRLIRNIHVSSIKEEIESLANSVLSYKQELFFEETLSEKYIYLIYGNSKNHKINDYNFAFIGNQTLISFRYFVGYEFKGTFDEICYYTKIHRADLSRNENVRERESNRKNHYIRGVDMKDYTKIKWTQEREDFLNKLEANFDNMREILNNFLSNLNNDTIEGIIEQNNLGLLLQSPK